MSLSFLVTNIRFEIIDKTECEKRQNLIVNRETMRKLEKYISIIAMNFLQCRENYDDIRENMCLRCGVSHLDLIRRGSRQNKHGGNV